MCKEVLTGCTKTDLALKRFEKMRTKEKLLQKVNKEMVTDVTLSGGSQIAPIDKIARQLGSSLRDAIYFVSVFFFSLHTHAMDTPAHTQLGAKK